MNNASQSLMHDYYTDMTFHIDYLYIDYLYIDFGDFWRNMTLSCIFMDLFKMY